MRKLTITFLLLFSLFHFAEAQFQLGLKFSPAVSSNRVKLISDQSNDTLDIGGAGSRTVFSLGLIGDYNIADTYIFNSGIIWIPKKIRFTVAPGDDGGSYPNAQEEYNLQYLQIPITLKLYTNEILPDLAIFFQLGMASEFKVFEEPDREEYVLIDRFRFFDTSVILGGGVEYRAGINTILFVDVNYQRGLVSAIKSTGVPVEGDFTIRNSMLMFEFGIKF